MKSKIALIALVIMPAALNAETRSTGATESLSSLSPCLTNSVPSAFSAAGRSSAAPVVAETLLSDGTTNRWSQADLVAALGLLNRRYRRDIETESGRRAWHGREVGQTLLTNDAGRLVMRRTYADGFTFDDAARRQTARVAASNMAARVRASLPTNGVSPRVANLRAQSAANAGTTVTNVTVTVGGVTVRRMPRYARAYDDYGNVTNKTLVGWQETFKDEDGVLTIRILDADGNLVRERKQRHPSKSRAAGNATKED